MWVLAVLALLEGMLVVVVVVVLAILSGGGGGLGVGSVVCGALRPTPSLELASWAEAHEKCKNELDDQT